MNTALPGNINTMVAEGGLLDFLENAVLPVYSGDIIINVMDYLPMLKQGYFLMKTMRNVIFEYPRINHLIDAKNPIYMIPDTLLVTAFGGSIPAVYYHGPGAFPKISMQAVVERGLIPEYLNTFDVIKISDPNFDPTRFVVNHLDSMVNYNSSKLTSISELSIYLQNKDFVNALNNEVDITGDLLRIHRIFMKPYYQALNERISSGLPFTMEDIIVGDMTVTDIMEISIKDKRGKLLDKLLADPRTNKLIYAIVINDPEMVEKYINVYDPRDNDNEAYKVAVKYGNQVIIDRVRRVITERNQLEQQIFQTKLLPELYQYSRSLK
jgi:hypothetical protein